MHPVPRSLALGIGLLAFCATEAPACISIGAYGGLTNVALEATGFPVNIGSEGQTITANVSCDIIRTERWRVAAQAEYSWFAGNLNDIGVDTDLTLGARVGYMTSPSTQFYVAGGWSRLDTAFGDIDGWKVGPGVQFALGNTPFKMDLRYQYARYDVNDLLGSGVDAIRHEARLGLVYEFPVQGWFNNTSSSLK